MSITDELRDYAEDWGWVGTGAEKAQDRIEAIADRIDAELAERYVELPKDADGEYIHVGDVLTDGEYTFRVDELAAFGDGSWSIRNEDGDAWEACDVTHHHEPTVVDVLREFYVLAVRGKEAHSEDVDEGVLAKYAAKLRLAKEGE